MLSIRRKRLSKIIAAALVLIVLCSAGIAMARPQPAKVITRQQPQHATLAAAPKQVEYGLPMQLKIPKINVDAPIDAMAILPDGSMQAPNGPKNTGWFKLGPHPGEVGSAVIDGHYGRWKDGEASVFDDLNKLNPGDIISVIDDKGQNIPFVVRETRMLGKDQDSSGVFRATDGKAHLNLITCQGTWQQAQKTYTQRLVVFADKK